MRRPSSKSHEHRLASVGVRPTAKRLALAQLLFGEGHRHLTPEALWCEARDAGLQISLATVYNTLNEFRAAGLLGTVALPGGRTAFDTHTDSHYHLIDERSGQVRDLPRSAVVVSLAPGVVPEGSSDYQIDVMVRNPKLRPKASVG